MIFRSIQVFIALIAFSSVLLAKQSIDGLSGLIQMPTAEVIKFQEFEIDADYDLNVDSNNSLYTNYQYKINIGTFENLEMGIVRGKIPAEGVYFNAKYLLLTEQNRYPLAVALGTKNIGSKTNSQAFLVLSKPFPQNIHMHLGFRAVFEDKLRSAVMLGGEYIFNDFISAQAEILENSSNYSLNAGIYLKPFSNFHVRVSGLDLNKEDLSRLNLGGGFSFFL